MRCLLAGFLLLVVGPAFVAQPAERPNVILAMADDQGWGDMAYAGHPVLKTPVFDEMARTGLRFDRFYAAAPVCSPTRGSVMTGRTPNRFGCFKWGYTLRPAEVTVAEVLRDAGYATGHFGKWHLGPVRADSPVSPGRSGFEQWFSSPNFFDLDPWMSQNGKAIRTKGEGSEVIVDAALDFIRKAARENRPFLAVVWFGSPHLPHAALESDLAVYADQPKKQQAFLAEITAMDRAMGKLRKGLRDAGIAEKTLLWYCSDNGAIPQGSTGGLRGRKGQIWEGGLRVPALIEWPAKIRSPRTTALPSGTVDIYPTLLELAGARATRQPPLDGVSLVPLLEGTMESRPRPLGFWDYAIGGLPVRSTELLETLAKEQAAGKVRPAEEAEPIPAAQLRRDYSDRSFPGHSVWLDGDWKLHRIETKNERVTWELYNLAADRSESNDRLSAEPDRTARMKAALTGWLRSVVASLNGQDDAADAGPAKPLTLEQLRSQRVQLAHRQRRLIFNNDGCDCLYFPKDKPATAENLLALRTTDLAGTQVDSIFYCTISSGFSFFTHRTRAGTVLTRSPSDLGIQPDKRNIAQELIDQGTDCLQVMVDFARKHHKEIFWSMRMNDTHDVEHRPDKPYFLFPPLKSEHPDWLVGDPVRRTRCGRWSSVDYARPEIRDLAFRFLEEVCLNYDVDGVELDFFRHLCYFKEVASGGKASRDDCDKMTDLLRRVRRMSEERGLARGRPILIAVRVPDSVEYCRDMGFDLPRWLEEGLVDLLVTTCYFQLNPWPYSVALGHKHGVPVYPSLSESRVRGQSRFSRGSVECYRGRAANAWLAGMDGMYLFNFFDVSSSRSPVLREIGGPGELRGKNKLYFATVRDGNPNAFLAGGDRYRTLPVLTPTRPKTIARGKPMKVNLTIGEDLAAARQAGLDPRLECHVQIALLQDPGQVLVKFNGQVLTGGTLSKGWLDLPLPPQCVRRGDNEVEIALSDQPSARDLSCADLVVSETYPKGQ